MDEDPPPPLPGWVLDVAEPEQRLDDETAALDAAVDLAMASAREGHGPFGAVVCDPSLDVVSLGWNRVIEARDSTAHAEIEAIRVAQLRLDTHDLADTDRGELTLFSSCAPCVMCFGALYWSGVSRVVSAAPAEAAEAIGFDEGPVTEAMRDRARKEKELAFEREVATSRDPREPFRVYEEQGGEVY